MHPNTQYHLEEYLKNKKKADAEKPPREPSGFMKKQADKTPPRKSGPKRASRG